MDERQPDALEGNADRLGAGEDEVDAQQLLNAASRAITAVRRQAADLLRHHRELLGDDEQRQESAN